MPTPPALHPTEDRPPLTPREREVWQLVADGLTDKQIGAALSIRYGTVRAYVTALCWKLSIEAGKSTRVCLANRYRKDHPHPTTGAA